MNLPQPQAAATPRIQPHPLRRDLSLIASWIPNGSRVLDLGCGDGDLLAYLKANKACDGYGVEIDDAQLLACMRRGVCVIQRNIEDGLELFGKKQFDTVVLSMAIQATKRTESVLREICEVGREAIVSFPNFGHWSHAWSILRGRMPVSREMPYQWYDTPNLHLSTPRDFEILANRLGLVIVDKSLLKDGQPIRGFAAMRATQAIYRLRLR
jgi:methionine biosynthesis protein MetW